MSSGAREGKGLTRQAARLGIAGPLVFVAGIVVAGAVTPGYSHLSKPISQLAAFGQPYPAIQMIGFVVFGVSMLAVAYGLRLMLESRRSATIGVFLVALAGVSMVGTGIFRADPMDQDPLSLSGIVHIATAMVLFPALCTAFIVLSRAMKKDDRWRGLANFSMVSGIAGWIFLIGYSAAFELQPDWLGVWQRFLAATFVIWFVVTSRRLAALSTE
jgi:hypothetical membrane protein